MNWHISIEAAGEGPAPDADDLFDLMDVLSDYHASATGTTEGTADGTNRYGASMLVKADLASAAATTAVEKFTKGTEKVGLPAWPIVRFSLMTEADLDTELARPNFPALLGVTELGELLGVSRQRASAISKGPTFPRPVAILHAGPVWTEPSVRHFVDTWERKSGRPRKETAAV